MQNLKVKQRIAAVFVVFTAGVLLRLGLTPGLVYGGGKLVTFTAREVAHTYDPDGREITTESVVAAHRADGSIATLTTRHTNPIGGLSSSTTKYRKIADVVSGTSFTAVPALKIVSSTPLGPEEVKSLTTPAQCSEPSEGLSISNDPDRPEILGFDVVKIVVHSKLPDGEPAGSIESWQAPELGCYPLRMVATGSSGSVQKVVEVVSVDLAEVDPALFAFPDGFEEMPPSEVIAAMARSAGVEGYRPAQDVALGLDERYHRNRRE